MAEKKRTLYELLVRYDSTGVYQGAHVKYLEWWEQDGEVLGDAKITDAIPIGQEGATAGDLGGVLTAVQAEALATAEARAADLATAAAVIEQREAELEAANQHAAELAERVSTAEASAAGATEALEQIRADLAMRDRERASPEEA